MESQSSFPQFSQLPAELRCKIWRFAIPRRTIPARLKLDLDAWNAATEADWMQHYRVVFDGPVPSLPPLPLVNHEARYEITRSYSKPLEISRAAVAQSLGTRSGVVVDDATFEDLCAASRIVRFNPECDVLEWKNPKRWMPGVPSPQQLLQPHPLFLAACLSVRHVSLEYEGSMHKQLEALAAAVFDRDQPLETLTVALVLPSEEQKHQFRLARRPSSLRLLDKDEKDVRAILSQHSTCFIPWCKDLADGGAAALRKDCPPVDQIAATKDLPPPVAPETRQNPEFLIYKVSSPDNMECNDFVSWFWYVSLYPEKLGIKIRNPDNLVSAFL
ncbi:Bifunctional purine biosynthesis protein PurH [Hypoxylon texense]